MAFRDYDRDREFRERGYSGKEDEAERERDRTSGDAPDGDRDRAGRGADDTDLGFRRPDFTEREFGTDPDRSGEPDERPDPPRDVPHPR
jgi:hypothetical protein